MMPDKYSRRSRDSGYQLPSQGLSSYGFTYGVPRGNGRQTLERGFDKMTWSEGQPKDAATSDWTGSSLRNVGGTSYQRNNTLPSYGGDRTSYYPEYTGTSIPRPSFWGPSRSANVRRNEYSPSFTSGGEHHESRYFPASESSSHAQHLRRLNYYPKFRPESSHPYAVATMDPPSVAVSRKPHSSQGYRDRDSHYDSDDNESHTETISTLSSTGYTTNSREYSGTSIYSSGLSSLSTTMSSEYGTDRGTWPLRNEQEYRGRQYEPEDLYSTSSGYMDSSYVPPWLEYEDSDSIEGYNSDIGESSDVSGYGSEGGSYLLSDHSNESAGSFSRDSASDDDYSDGVYSDDEYSDSAYSE